MSEVKFWEPSRFQCLVDGYIFELYGLDDGPQIQLASNNEIGAAIIEDGDEIRFAHSNIADAISEYVEHNLLVSIQKEGLPR